MSRIYSFPVDVMTPQIFTPNLKVKLVNESESRQYVVDQSSQLFEKIMSGIREELEFFERFEGKGYFCEVDIVFYPSYDCYILGFNILNPYCHASAAPGIVFNENEIFC